MSSRLPMNHKDPGRRSVNPDPDWKFDASDSMVRSILVALCEDGKVEKRAQELLRKFTKPDIYHKIKRTDESSENGNGGPAGSSLGKRKASPSQLYQVCVRCDEPFFPEDNEELKCVFHPGELELYEDARVWDEWEDWRDGEMDCDETRRRYPCGFIWDCCSRRGMRRGCTRGRHKESLTLKRFRRNGAKPKVAVLQPDAPHLSEVKKDAGQASDVSYHVISSDSEDGCVPTEDDGDDVDDEAW